MPRVTIIGAGPAGSTAALRLARAEGWQVTLIEQHRFPRDKVCGECLGAMGIDVLERLDLASAVAALDPIVFARTIIHSTDGASLHLPLPRVMWGVPRRQLDACLLGAARDAGAELLQPARCEGIECDADEVVVTVRSLESNRIETLRSDFLLVADGKGAHLPPRDRPAPSGDFGIKAHFEDVDGPRDAIELFALRGCYGGLAAVERDRWNAAFSVAAARLRAHRGDVAQLFEEMVLESPILRVRLRGSRRVAAWLAAPLPRFPISATRFHDQRIIPLGNAAAAIEPIGGEGMGLAMRSAELAVDELIRAHNEDRMPRIDALQTEFMRLWRTRSVTCRTAARAVSSPRLSNLGLRLFDGPSPLTRVAMRLMGK